MKNFVLPSLRNYPITTIVMSVTLSLMEIGVHDVDSVVQRKSKLNSNRKGEEYQTEPINMENLFKITDLPSFKHVDLTILSSSSSSSSLTPHLPQNEELLSWCQTYIFPVDLNTSNKSTNGTFLPKSIILDPMHMNLISDSGFPVVFVLLKNLNETLTFLNQVGDFYSNFVQFSKWSWQPIFFLVFNSSDLNPPNNKSKNSGTGQNFTELIKTEFAPRFNLSSQVYLVPLEGDGMKVQSVFEIYHVKNASMLQPIQFWHRFKKFGQDSIKVINLKQVVRKTGRRSNFQQAEIVVVNVDHPDYRASVKYKHDNETGKLEFESGFDVEVVFYLRDALNLSITATAWDGFVKPGPNGTLKGLAVPINTGLADLIGGTTEFLEYRFSGPDGLTFLHPTFHNEILVFFKQPAASSIRDIFLLTFTTELWLAVMGTWALIVVSLLTVNRLRRRMDRDNFHPEDSQLSKDVLLWTVSTIAQQGWHISPVAMSMKIIFLVGVITGLLTYVAYSSSLVAILSVQVVPVRKFADLLEHKFEILSDSHIPTTTQVVRSLEERGIIKILPDGGRNIEVSEKLSQMVKKKIAIVSITDSFYQVLFTRDERNGPHFACNILSNVLFSRRPAVSSMNVQRGSPLRENFNAKMALMRERGIMFRYRLHYILETSIQCLRKDSGFQQTLGAKDVFTAYIILLSGFSFSLLFGLIERAFFLSKRFK